MRVVRLLGLERFILSLPQSGVMQHDARRSSGAGGCVLVTPGWVTPKGAADYLQVSESTLYALRRAGDGPSYAKRGQLVRYSIADLDAWMRQNMEDPNENE